MVSKFYQSSIFRNSWYFSLFYRKLFKLKYYISVPPDIDSNLAENPCKTLSPFDANVISILGPTENKGEGATCPQNVPKTGSFPSFPSCTLTWSTFSQSACASISPRWKKLKLSLMRWPLGTVIVQRHSRLCASNNGLLIVPLVPLKAMFLFASGVWLGLHLSVNKNKNIVKYFTTKVRGKVLSLSVEFESLLPMTLSSNESCYSHHDNMSY